MVDRISVYDQGLHMPLSKEKMREYMKKRRERERVGIHGIRCDCDEGPKSQPCPLHGNDFKVLGNPEAVEDTGADGGSDVATPGIDYVVDPYPFKVRHRTPTDALFEKDRPSYYIFNQDVVERGCWRCGKGFKTRMELNKFCSPKCKDGYLDEAFGRMRKSQ